MHGTLIGAAQMPPLGMVGADVPPTVSTKGIAILGSHPATVAMAPFNDDWLIYTCSPHNIERRQLPRWDEWFEIHIPVAHRTRGQQYLEALKDMPLVWMRDKSAMDYFPGAKLYPEDEMKKEFSPFHFTSSIAFIMAKAIKDCERLGVKQIGLYGIMQASANEYTYQRPGVQYFIWEAVKRGIKVIAPDVSRLFEPPPEDF
jgi:hypothetical protein